MNIELDNTTLLIAVLLLAVAYFCLYGRKEKWTLLEGGQQEWQVLPRNENVCDTGFDDDSCKYSAINCLKNPNSALYDNRS
jgi:hypothetical protein